jgi:hypothetical protein
MLSIQISLKNMSLKTAATLSKHISKAGMRALCHPELVKFDSHNNEVIGGYSVFVYR